MIHAVPHAGRADLFDGVSGWAARWHGATLSNPTPAGRKAIQAVAATSSPDAIQSPTSAYNARVLARIRQANSGTAYAIGLIVRVAGTATAKEGVYFRLQAANINMGRISASGTLSSNITNSSRGGNTPQTWYWFDLLMVGSRYLFQFWEAGTPRPDGWLIAATYASLTGVGIGFWTPNPSCQLQCDKFIVLPVL